MRGLLSACWLLACTSAGAAEPALVATQTVSQQNWRQTLSLYGTLTSPHDAQLTPRVAGLVDTVAVDAGDRVAKGDTLLTLDRQLARLTLDTTQASLAQAKAQLVEARRLRGESQALAERGAVSTTELAARRSQVAVRAAEVKRLSAQLAHQKERLARHTLIAPFDGVIRQRLVEPGEYVTQSTPAVALVATERLRVDVSAPQQYFSMIAPGMPVRIQSEAGPAIEAEVDVVVPASNAEARSFLVRIFVDNEPGRLTPGMSAQVLFEITSPEPVLVAPRDALVRVPGGGTRMWVLEQNGAGYTVVKRQVTLGRSAHNEVEIRAGIEAGERVVVRGNEGLKPGQTVTPQTTGDENAAARNTGQRKAVDRLLRL